MYVQLLRIYYSIETDVYSILVATSQNYFWLSLTMNEYVLNSTSKQSDSF